MNRYSGNALPELVAQRCRVLLNNAPDRTPGGYSNCLDHIRVDKRLAPRTDFVRAASGEIAATGRRLLRLRWHKFNLIRCAAGSCASTARASGFLTAMALTLSAWRGFMPGWRSTWRWRAIQRRACACHVWAGALPRRSAMNQAVRRWLLVRGLSLPPRQVRASPPAAALASA